MASHPSRAGLPAVPGLHTRTVRWALCLGQVGLSLSAVTARARAALPRSGPGCPCVRTCCRPLQAPGPQGPRPGWQCRASWLSPAPTCPPGDLRSGPPRARARGAARCLRDLRSFQDAPGESSVDRAGHGAQGQTTAPWWACSLPGACVCTQATQTHPCVHAHSHRGHPCVHVYTRVHTHRCVCTCVSRAFGSM